MAVTYFSNPEARAFLQRRVAALGLVMVIICGVALAFRTAMGLSLGMFEKQATHPTYWFQALAMIPSLALWLICRRGELSVRAIGFTETICVLLIGIAFIGIGMFIPPEAGADSVTSFALAILLLTRAAIVPSTARRTALLGIAMGVPLIAMMYYHYLGVDLTMWRRLGSGSANLTAASVAMSAAFITATWWTLTVGLSSLFSRIIHRLRTEVQAIQNLGQYQLEDKLGEGAMGVVYQATHGMLKRPTAVKLLQPSLAREGALERFRREVQLTAKLTHPNTVTIYDYGRTPDGLFYYAMELLDGATLQQVVETAGPQPIARVVMILRDAALALQEAHEIGLIHRDIKPGNIMLAWQGGVPDVTKVLDFGLVKNIEAIDDIERTTSKDIAGTPAYMSPEAINEPDTIDARSDLYCLGAVGYYLLAGRNVFEGNNVVQVCLQHLQTEPTPLRDVCSAPIPVELEAIVMSCLAKSPDDRPASASVLADALDALDIAPWTRAHAEAWWDEHGIPVDEQRTSMSSGVKYKTIEVDRTDPWFDTAEG